MATKERLALKIERLYQGMELNLLENLAKTLKGNGLDKIEDIQEWKIERLRDKNKLRRANKKIIGAYRKPIDEAYDEYISLVIEEAIKSNDDDLDDLLSAGVITFVPWSKTKKAIEPLYTEAKSKAYEISKAAEVNISDSYTEIVNKAFTEVTRTGKPIVEVVSKTVEEKADSGITVATTEKGANISLDGAVSTNIRNTDKRVGIAAQNARLDEMGIDLVEISSHLDCRPTHAPFQGRIYSRSGNSDKYPPLESTGYGKVDGLITGINCRHRMYGYIEGVSEKHFTPYPKEITDKNYKLSQKQRQLEREIRRAKRRKKALEDIGASQEKIDKVDRLIKKRQKRIREFLKETGRTRNRDRESVNFE